MRTFSCAGRIGSGGLVLMSLLACSSAEHLDGADDLGKARVSDSNRGSDSNREDTSSSEGQQPSSADAGTSTSGTADAEAPDAAAPDATPGPTPGFRCGSETCSETTSCCWSIDPGRGPGFGSCKAKIGGVPASCGSGMARVLCASDADCSAGRKCCATRLKGSFRLIQVACNDECVSPDPDYLRLETCNPQSGSKECGAGRVCIPDEGTNAPFGRCF
jgi:hypothetical protein